MNDTPRRSPVTGSRNLQQDTTNCNVLGIRSTETGLTRAQEMAAELFVSGKGMQEVADTLRVHRSTVWHCRQSPTFVAYHNRLCAEIRDEAKDGLIGLQQDALAAMRKAVTSPNEGVAFRVASFIFAHLHSMEIGDTDVRETFRKQSMETVNCFEFISGTYDVFNPTTYKSLCEEAGVNPGED